VIDFETVAVDKVSRHFGRRRALSRVTFTARTGAILGLLGPNGAGKSTMLALLATLAAPSEGEIRYGAGDVSALGPAVRSRIGVLGHDLFLYPELTAFENLAFFAGLYAIADAPAAARAALTQAGLADRADDPISSLSRGMRQRVALERALIQQPRLVLLDEPFTGLDDESTSLLAARLRDLRDRGAIVVMATHDFESAEGLVDRVVCLREGRAREVELDGRALRGVYRRVMSEDWT
jgi:heme exporter protein A